MVKGTGSGREFAKAAALLGVGIVLASLVFGLFFFESRRPQQTITVVGTASKQYEADTVKWSLSLTERTGLDDLAGGRRRLYDSLQEMLHFLRESGVDDSEVTIIPPSVYEFYGSSGIEGYRLEQQVYVISQDVDTIDNLALEVLPQLDTDLDVYNSRLEYFYSNLDELKKDMVGEATQNARERALEMLKGSDMSLGKLRTLRQGVFQITQPHSTEVSSMGIHDTSTKSKQISVTAHATFEIK
ncbi:MAG: SIMPL domain-containing protein [Firmicutes bacterium]|nr:SIMPL domain-containing protein [Bacillota bacterium]